MAAALRLRSVRLAGHSLIRDAVTVAALIYLVWVWQFLMVAGSHVDVAAYWRAAGGDPYALSHLGDEGAGLYSPVVWQILAPLGAMPISVLIGVLLAVSIAGLVYLVGPIIAALTLVTPLPFIWQDLGSGNIHILVAAAMVLGFRYPATWSFVLLTKVTPGIGLLWFVVRREWRALAIALGFTALLAVVSFVAAPHLWLQWFEVLRTNATTTPAGIPVPVPLLIRLPAAAAIVCWGAWTDRAWTVPVAATLALPAIWVWDGFAVLLGVISLVRRPLRATTA